MCYNCGCMDPKDNMGSNDNITDDTIEKAANASHQTVDEALQNIFEMIKQKLGK